jgi:hypothetical protein
LRKLLRGCEADYVTSFSAGLDALSRNPYSQVVIDLLFADSCMFEFARSVQQNQPAAGVVCVKIAGRPLDAGTRAGIDSTLHTLGYEGLIDLSPRAAPGGEERRATATDRRANRRIAFGGRRADDRRALLL